MKKRLLLTVVTFLISSCSISTISSSNTSSSENITSNTTSEEVSSSESSLEESSSISSSSETSSVGSSSTSSDTPSSSVETPSSSSQASSSISSSSIEVADLKEYDLEGFASSLVTSKDTLKVVEVRNAKEFSAALNNNKKDVVIDIKEDLNLGYEEVKKEFGTLAKITAAKTPVQHPILKETGVSKIGVEDRENIAIISTNGSSIKHACFNIKRCKNVIVRNIEFNELWEWDDVKDNSGNKPGDYDRNDWDYVTVSDSEGVWIDHCTFHKAYDGLIDMKVNSSSSSCKGLTISYCKFLDGQDDPFVKAQFDDLERRYQEDKNNTDDYQFYATCRNKGLSKDQIQLISTPIKKGHLVGSTDNTSYVEAHKGLSITIANCYYRGQCDRLPRLRGGNAHIYNVIDDATNVARAAAISIPSSINSTKYSTGKEGHLGVTRQAIVTTNDGNILVDNSIFKGVGILVKNKQSSSISKGAYLFSNCKDIVLDSSFNVKSQVIFTTDGTDSSYSRGKGNESSLPFDEGRKANFNYEYTLKNVDELSYDVGVDKTLSEIIDLRKVSY